MILVVSNMYPSERHPNYGVFVKNFYERFKSDRPVDLIALQKEEKYSKKIINYLIFFLRVFFNFLNKKYDLVYVHYAGYNGLPILLAKLFNKKTKLVVNVHGSDVTPEKKLEELTNFLTKYLVRSADLTVVPSNYFERVVKEKYGDIFTFISPSAGIDLELFNPRNKVINNEEKLIIGYVGRIDSQKGWDTLLYALKELVCDIQNIRLVMVGSGSENLKAIELIKKLELDKYVEKIEMVKQNELVNIYRKIDLFIFPSTRSGESLGLVGLEAMACGTPVIGSACAGIETYVKDCYNGFLFNPGDIKHLKEKIKEYYYSSLTCKISLSENAILTSKEYEAHKIHVKLKSVIDTILGEG